MPIPSNSILHSYDSFVRSPGTPCADVDVLMHRAKWRHPHVAARLGPLGTIFTAKTPVIAFIVMNGKNPHVACLRCSTCLVGDPHPDFGASASAMSHILLPAHPRRGEMSLVSSLCGPTHPWCTQDTSWGPLKPLAGLWQSATLGPGLIIID